MGLKDKSISEAANKLTALLRNAMDALDKGYLRQLIIKILESNEQQEAFETYTFNFNKIDLEGNVPASPGFNLTRSEKNSTKLNKAQNINGSMVQNIIESEDLIENTKCQGYDQYTIYNATKNWLQKLNMALQGLQLLPNRCYINVTIGYHDDITPENYHPNGFFAYSNERCDENLCPLEVGEVKSNFHEVKMAMAAKSLAAPDNVSDECLVGSMDKSADSVSQGEEYPLHNNTSIIPLKPGLDESELEQTDSGGNINLSHGSNVVDVCNDNEAVENLETDFEIPSNLGRKRKNGRKYSEMCSESKAVLVSANKDNSDVQMGNAISKKRKKINVADRNMEARNSLSRKYSEMCHEPSRPTAHGDNTNDYPIKEISKRMKELKAGDIGDVGNSLNNSRSSIYSIRSPKILNAIQRVVSVPDTFTEERSYENVQPKASISEFVIAI